MLCREPNTRKWKNKNIFVFRFSNYCSYSMFNNESTESLNSGAASPASVKMNKSQSISRLAKQQTDTSHHQDGQTEEQSSIARQAHILHIAGNRQ